MAQNEFITDRGRSWIVAACCCFCNLTFYGVSRLSGMMLVAATHTFQVSRARAAVPFSLSTAIRSLSGVFVGHLAHRVGVGPIVAIGCLIASLGSGLCFFAKDMQWLNLCWGGVFGIGFGFSTCLLPLAINQNFTKHSGTASGISYSGSYIGSFLFPPIVVWLLDSFGLQGTFLIISGGVLHVFIAAILLTKSKTDKKRSQKSASDLKPSERTISEENMDFQCNKDTPVFNNNNLLYENIHRVYTDSQAILTSNNQNKSNIDVFTSNHPFQDSIHMKSSLGNEETSKTICESNHSLHPKTSHNSWIPKVLRNFKFKSACHQECMKTSPTPNISQASNTSSPISITNNNGCDLHQKIQYMDVSLSETAVTDAINNSAKQSPIVPKAHSGKIDFESRALSKGKSKAKYKLKLQKLKKVLIASLLNRARFLKGGCLQADNVKLISFRYFDSFRCPNTSNAFIPNKQLYSISNQNSSNKKRSVKERNYSTYRFLKKFDNYTVTSLKETENGDVINLNGDVIDLNGASKEAENKNLQSDLSDSLKYYGKPVCSAEQLRKSSISTNTADSSVEDIYKLSHNSNLQVYESSKNSGDLTQNKIDIDIINISSEIYTICNRTDGNHIPSNVLNSSSQLSAEAGMKFRPENNTIKSPDIKSRYTGVIKKHFPDWFCMLCEPMFIIISVTMSIHTFVVVCVVTTIEDYAKDVGVPENKVHYALMALSIANLVGTLTLGFFTDRGFISRHRFISLCFLGMSLLLVAVSVFVVSLPSLLSVIAVYGLLESGVIITFPILTKQFVKGERRQAVAIASSNVLSAPTVMLVPMLIGHFRDNIGCYSGLFHLLAATSFTCSFVWLVAPSLHKRRKLKKLEYESSTHCCSVSVNK